MTPQIDLLNSTVATYLTFALASYVAGLLWFIRMEVKMSGLKIELDNQRTDIHEQKEAIANINKKLDGLTESLAEQKSDIRYIKEGQDQIVKALTEMKGQIG